MKISRGNSSVNGISLPREYWKLIDDVAARRGMSRSAVVQRLIKKQRRMLERAARGEEVRL